MKELKVDMENEKYRKGWLIQRVWERINLDTKKRKFEKYEFIKRAFEEIKRRHGEREIYKVLVNSERVG